MPRWMSRALSLLVVALGLALLPAGPAAAHPLGNFTVNTADRLVITADGLEITHVVDLAEIPTVQLTQARTGADTSGNKVLSEPELGAYAQRECARIGSLLVVEVDGTPVALTDGAASGRSVPGTAGLPTTRFECAYTTEVRPRSTVSFSDPVANERNGWREITATSRCGALPDSSVPVESVSGLLTAYPVDLLKSPSDVTTATFSVRAGAACTGDSSSAVAGEDQVAPRGVDRVSRFFTDFLGRPDLTAAFAVVSIVASVLFGVLHALAPGHGKTVMAAYLVGQRGTRRQALQLGAVVTFTHTISVLLLGAVLAAGALAAPELVVPFTEVLSGVLLAVVGVYLLVLARRRLRAVPDHEHGGEGDHGHAGEGDHGHGDHEHGDHEHGDHEHGDHEHGGHDHDGHGVHVRPEQVPDRALVGAAPSGGGVAVATEPIVHSHGGRAHTHAPLPEGPLSWKTLAGMGVAGGLVPSPSALLVLLSATALGRAWFGVLLVICYGLGMAITLTLAGLLLLRARATLDRRGWTTGRGRRLTRLLPLGTGAIVVLVGLGLVVRGLVSGRGLL